MHISRGISESELNRVSQSLPSTMSRTAVILKSSRPSLDGYRFLVADNSQVVGISQYRGLRTRVRLPGGVVVEYIDSVRRTSWIAVAAGLRTRPWVLGRVPQADASALQEVIDESPKEDRLQIRKLMENARPAEERFARIIRSPIGLCNQSFVYSFRSSGLRRQTRNLQTLVESLQDAEDIVGCFSTSSQFGPNICLTTRRFLQLQQDNRVLSWSLIERPRIHVTAVKNNNVRLELERDVELWRWGPTEVQSNELGIFSDSEGRRIARLRSFEMHFPDRGSTGGTSDRDSQTIQRNETDSVPVELNMLDHEYASEDGIDFPPLMLRLLTQLEKVQDPSFATIIAKLIEWSVENESIVYEGDVVAVFASAVDVIAPATGTIRIHGHGNDLESSSYWDFLDVNLSDSKVDFEAVPIAEIQPIQLEVSRARPSTVRPEPVRPDPIAIRNPLDAERAAATWMRYWGFRDALETPAGSDAGKDVDAGNAVAQVKAHMVPVGRPDVQNLFGVAAAEKKEALFFSLSGYTAQAEEWAEMAGVSLFTFDLLGVPTPFNRLAAELVRSRKTAS